MGFLRPRKLDKEKIAARVAAAPEIKRTPNVAPLAADFFKLQAMRIAQRKLPRALRG